MSALRLVIDIGNTRLKWGLSAGDGAWQGLGALPLAGLTEEALGSALAGLPAPVGCVGACVAGSARRELVGAAIEKYWNLAVQWQSSQPVAAGIRNAYAYPERLGVDRWAAVAGAWHLAPQPAVVVCAGTATTVDLLLPAGADESKGIQAVFQGGYILPGLDLMRSALAGETAQLPLASGELHAVPRLTDDAIVSGCLWAQAGAIARLLRELPAGGRLWLTGGGAARLLPALQEMLATPPAVLRETLILDGLLALAGTGQPPENRRPA